jgi:beta-galactosidase
MTSPPLNHTAQLWHGACYYPELWPEPSIDVEITKMRDLGINVVRLCDFAWSSMEPHEGQISLDLFVRVMDKLAGAGLAAVICTPTAGPPIWLTHNRPDRCFTAADGTPMSHGSRQHASYDHPEVFAACMRIVDAQAKALGRHPALLAWQIDNELKCHVDQDFNAHSIKLWHLWLQKKFTTIASLNHEWGTHGWSTHYQSFDQVPAPKTTPFLHNPCLVTAWQEFTQHRIADFADAQAAIIRRHSAAPITHNSHSMFPVDYGRLYQNLDFASFDAYPPATNFRRIIFDCDLFRAAKPGRPFWLMETSVAHNGWTTAHEPAHPPGFLHAQAMACYALGAQGVNYWLWRQMRTNCELPHSAILHTWGTPSIGAQGVRTISTTLDQLRPKLLATRPVRAQVAITWSDRARRMIRAEPLGNSKHHSVEYNPLLQRWHRLLLDAGLHREFCYEAAPLDGLKLLFTPILPCIDEPFLARARAFVESGGIWVVGPLSGYRNSHHAAHTDLALGQLESLAGVQTIFAFPLTATDNPHGTALGQSTPLGGWCFATRPADSQTQVIGTLQQQHADSLAFITERTLGKGKLVLLTAEPVGDAGDAFLSHLITHYAAQANLTHHYRVSPGTLAVPRSSPDGQTQLLLLINLDGKGGHIDLPTLGTISVGRYEVRALPLP